MKIGMENLVCTSYKYSAELHKKLKAAAVLEGVSLNTMAGQVIELGVRQWEKEHGAIPVVK